MILEVLAIAGGVGAATAGALGAAVRWARPGPPPTRLELAKAAYVAGRIEVPELERRIEAALRPPAPPAPGRYGGYHAPIAELGRSFTPPLQATQGYPVADDPVHREAFP